MMLELNGCLSFIVDDELMKKHNDIWNLIEWKENLIANPYTIDNLWKPK